MDNYGNDDNGNYGYYGNGGGYGNNGNAGNGYNGYYQSPSNLPQPEPPKPKKPHRGRGLALALVGAILGSVIGGGGVALDMGAQDTGLSAEQQAYIDKAVADAADSADVNGLSSTESGTVGDTINLVTTDYSTTVQNVAADVSDSVVGIATSEGTGSGVIVSSDGLILTNAHVIALTDSTQLYEIPGFFGNQPQQTQDTTITVTLEDGKEYTATVLYSDEAMDLAVLKIDATGLPAVTLGDSDNVTVGEITVAIGNPLGLEQTVTSGIVSALGVSAEISSTQIAEDLIQTDAAINPGNSGGALLNASGEVIGINSYKLSNGEGIGFAIPINAAKPIIAQIVATGEFKQAVIGASLVDKELLEYSNYDITLDSGLYVYEVSASSDAAAQGLKAGDIITAIDGVSVNSILEAKEQLYKHVPGDKVTLSVTRDGKTMEIQIELSEAS